MIYETFVAKSSSILFFQAKSSIIKELDTPYFWLKRRLRGIDGFSPLKICMVSLPEPLYNGIFSISGVIFSHFSLIS